MADKLGPQRAGLQRKQRRVPPSLFRVGPLEAARAAFLIRSPPPRHPGYPDASGGGALSPGLASSLVVVFLSDEINSEQNRLSPPPPRQR